MDVNINTDLTVLISSCDKFSDLWDENIHLYKEKWKNNNCRTALVTDKQRGWYSEGIELMVDEGENDFPLRIRFALDRITTPYVLVTLDDYFLIDTVNSDHIRYLVERMKNEQIDYLSLYNRRYAKERDRRPLEDLLPIDLNQNYAVNLYPAIWNVEFMKTTIKDGLSPWLYEVTMTETAKSNHAICKESRSGEFVILDVVRKGRVLHNAQRYFKQYGIDIGDRPSAAFSEEIILAARDWITWHTPKAFFEFMKSVGRKMGMTFYSDILGGGTSKK